MGDTERKQKKKKKKKEVLLTRTGRGLLRAQLPSLRFLDRVRIFRFVPANRVRPAQRKDVQ